MLSVYQFFFNLLHRNSGEPLKSPVFISAPLTNIQPLIREPIISDLRLAPDSTLSLQQCILKRQLLYESMTIRSAIYSKKGTVIVPNVPEVIKRKTDRMIANRARYESVAHTFPNPGLKWHIVALLHEMEAVGDFSKYLGNGQSLSKVTTIVPKGRGPFSSFKSGAMDALHYDKIDLVTDWSMGNLLYVLEGFNGRGYANYKNINSPYLWSGSNQYSSGKYVADGVFDQNAVSSQIGIALMLKNLDKEGVI